jgi:hypothetical protein
MKRYTFWFNGSMMTFDAETHREAFAMANDHFEPLVNDPDGIAWNNRHPHFEDDLEFIWY